MNARIRWLKVSFIAGAVADALVGILILIPSRMGETGFTYPMGLAASLMFGWTLVLLWGYRRPVERKGLLLIVIFLVIPGLMASGAYQVARGAFPIVRVLPTMILGAGLIVLFGFSYLNARTLSA